MKKNKTLVVLTLIASLISATIASANTMAEENPADISQLSPNELLAMMQAKKNQLVAIKAHLDNAQLVVYENDSKRYIVQNIGIIGTMVAGLGGLGFLTHQAVQNTRTTPWLPIALSLGTAIAIAMPILSMLAPANAQVVELTEKEKKAISEVVARLQSEIDQAQKALVAEATSNVEFIK
ncbi:MAG: hypothetical protein AB7F43_04155 [Bacteriovoracia bacterium]